MVGLERAINMDLLYRSWQKISANNACGGLDGIDLSFYRSDLQKNLRSLQTSVASGRYRPYTEKIYTNHKGRPISISCVDDKIIQTALANVIMMVYIPARSVHGFINKRSVFTAKKSLDSALTGGISEYSKVDIRHFYDSIDGKILFNKIALMFDDADLLALIELLINAHSPGLSAGSCLSPALSNLYLADFDREVEANSLFYARYVDDMLVAPTSNIELIKDKLAEVGLEIHPEKSETVNAAEGFKFLGFDIKHDIDMAIQTGNFELAQEIYEAQECDVAADAPVVKENVVPEAQPKPEYELPNIIRNVVRKCHIVESVVEKAKTDKRLDFGEKALLLQIFHCLGDGGARFIHHVLSHCEDYDYAETQRRIKRYVVNNPLGCKKLCERIGSHEGCACNFTNEKLYPTPIIHALRVDRECFKPTGPKDNIGHFRAKNPTDKATDALSAILELNKKQYEISEQQKILKGQIEDLFERTNTRELMAPQGLMFKTDDGIFIKVG
jgi:retron-type reverse transcriptase